MIPQVAPSWAPPTCGPLQPALASPNRTVAQVESAGGETLVLLTSAYRGWRLRVDGRPAELRNVGGYLAAPLQPGAHRYEFTFDPLSFKVGLVVSLASILGLLGLVIMDGRSKRLRLKIEAIYSEGMLRPARPLDIPEGTPVHVTVEIYGESAAGRVTPPTGAAEFGAETPEVGASAAGAAAPTAAEVVISAPPSHEDRSRRGLERLGWVLFGLGMFVYLFTRLWHIDKFPIYFFTDEAANPLFAQGLFDNGFRNAQGMSFPLYFELAANRWGPLLSVYIHAFSSALFGKSVIVTRATQALVSLLAPLAVALILKQIFKARFWWAGALLMALAPAWFLHSRTGFETIIAASFYGCFILFYLLYRTRSPRYHLRRDPVWRGHLLHLLERSDDHGGRRAAAGRHRHPLSLEALAHDWAGTVADWRAGDPCAAVPCRRNRIRSPRICGRWIPIGSTTGRSARSWLSSLRPMRTA